MSFKEMIHEKLEFLRNITGGGTSYSFETLKEDLLRAQKIIKNHLHVGGVLLPENDAFFMANYYVDKALEAVPDDLATAYARCTLALHELAAYPQIKDAADVVNILKDVSERIERRN